MGVRNSAALKTFFHVVLQGKRENSLKNTQKREETKNICLFFVVRNKISLGAIRVDQTDGKLITPHRQYTTAAATASSILTYPEACSHYYYIRHRTAAHTGNQ